MIGSLAVGTVVRLRRHEIDCVVGECLGAGGQGEVYRAVARVGDATQSLALKWYFPEWSTPQQWIRSNISMMPCATAFATGASRSVISGSTSMRSRIS